MTDTTTFGATDYTREQFEARVLLMQYAKRLQTVLETSEKHPAPKGQSTYIKDAIDTVERMYELKDSL